MHVVIRDEKDAVMLRDMVHSALREGRVLHAVWVTQHTLHLVFLDKQGKAKDRELHILAELENRWRAEVYLYTESGDVTMQQGEIHKVDTNVVGIDIDRDNRKIVVDIV